MIRLIFYVFAIVGLVNASMLKDHDYYISKFYNWLQKRPHLKPEDGNHFLHMLRNFAANDDIIESTNEKKLSFRLGHNDFSHLSLDEFKDYMRLGLGR